jgi:hypothetical protein
MNNLEELTKEELIALIYKLMDRIAELEIRLNQNSSNSSKPPSSDGLAKPVTKSLRGKSEKKHGGQRGHKGHGLKIDREPDEVVEITPKICPDCGADLSEEPSFHADTRYVYDVQIEVKLTQYDIGEIVCPNCGACVKAEAPAEAKSTVNYGNTLRSLIIVLTQYAVVGIHKVHLIMRDLIGLPISAGTIKNIMGQFAGKTDNIIKEIKQNLLTSPTLRVDETGTRVFGRTQWVHVASNSKFTLVTVNKKRGSEGTEAGGVVQKYTGTLIHDCWKPYFGFDKCEHALCCAHLPRELNALIEQGHSWAFDMKKLLLEMKNVVDAYKSDDKTELSQYYRRKFKNMYDLALGKGRAEIKPSSARKKSKAENLLVRLEEYQTEITRFSEDFDVSFDNNQAERDIRNNKLKQKVTGGFRTESGAEDFAKTSSVIGTAVKFSDSVVDTVKGIFSGNFTNFA